jgi:hypothetical protein
VDMCFDCSCVGSRTACSFYCSTQYRGCSDNSPRGAAALWASGPSMGGSSSTTAFCGVAFGHRNPNWFSTQLYLLLSDNAPASSDPNTTTSHASMHKFHIPHSTIYCCLQFTLSLSSVKPESCTGYEAKFFYSVIFIWIYCLILFLYNLPNV